MMYVGLKEFPNYQEAADYCTQRKLSWTLIHHEPLKLPKRFQK